MSKNAFDAEETSKYLTSQWIGRKIIYKEVTGTTMDDAVQAAYSGAPSGTAIIAEVQTQARGARCHKWESLHTGNIFVSFILHRVPEQESFVDRFDVEVCAALAVRRALLDFGLDNVKMKWPNDLWIHGHKIAGFLVEDKGAVSKESETPENLYILGVGLNVNSDIRRHPSLHSIATSVKCELHGKEVHREKLFAHICNYLEEALSWNREEIYQSFLDHQLLGANSPVKVYKADGDVFSATLLEVHSDWSIELKDHEQKIWTGLSTEFTVRPRPDQTVFIYKGKLSASHSVGLALKTLVSVIDTSLSSIVYISGKELNNGEWMKNASLIVICDIDSESLLTFKPWMTVVKTFVEKGGSFLGIRHGCDILYKSPIQDTIEDAGISENYALPIAESVEAIHVKDGLPDSDFFGVSVGKTFTFPESVIQSADIIANYGDNDCSTSPAILLTKFGSGRACLCGFNVEVTYLDVKEVCPGLMKNMVELQESVYNRDRLLQEILVTLGVQ